MSGWKKEQNWIGVDLDGTLAEFHEESYFRKYGPETIGKPIPKMVKRIKFWIEGGIKVKIFTARVAELTACYLESTVELMEDAVHVWLIKNLGFDLEVTNEKDCFMIELWDDIDLVQVERNTGKSKFSAQDRFMNTPINHRGVVFPGGRGSYRHCNNFPVKIKEINAKLICPRRRSKQ